MKKYNFIIKLLGCISLVILFISVMSFKINDTRVNHQEYSNRKSIRLKGILRKNKVNGLILINGNSNSSHPEVITNTPSFTSVKIKATHFFPIASLQKGLTGIAVYYLIKTKKINLDTPLSRFFPNLKNSNNIRIEQLMTHTSGICDKYKETNSILKKEKARERFIFKDFYINSKHTWHYASSNYGILSAIIRLETKGTYYKYINKQILIPDKLTGVKSFAQISNINDVTLPQKQDRKKITMLLNLLRVGKLFPQLSFLNISELINLISWRHLCKGLSENLGAGDFLATPNSYWDFFNKTILDNPQIISYFDNEAQKVKPHYFGGYYFKNKYILADGTLNKFSCCSVAANYKNKRTIMIFTNNISFKKFRKLQKKIYNLYLS